MTVAVDFVAALVGLRPPDAATKSKRPAFSKPRQRSTQNPRGAVQTTGASSLSPTPRVGRFIPACAVTHQRLSPTLRVGRFIPACAGNALRGWTPHEYVCKIWEDEPAAFKNDPTQLTSGLYTKARSFLSRGAATDHLRRAT